MLDNIRIVDLLLGLYFFQKSRLQFSCLKVTYKRPVIGKLQDLCRKQEFLYNLAFDNEIGKALISIVKTVLDIRCIDMTSTSFMSHPNKIVHTRFVNNNIHFWHRKYTHTITI